MHSVISTSTSNMMKFAFALVAVLAVVSPMQAYTVPRTGGGALAAEVQDFVDLVPVEEIVKILFRYIATDAEVQALVELLHSQAAKDLVIEIEAMSEVQNLMNYMQNAGLDIYYLVNKMNSYMGLKQLTPTNAQMVRATGGIRALLDEVEALIPTQKIKELHRQKMASSKVWADFVAQAKSPVFQNVANKLCDNAAFKSLLQKAKNVNVKVEAVIMVVENAMGVKFNCRP